MKRSFLRYLFILYFLLFSLQGYSADKQLTFCGSTNNDLFLLLKNEGFKLKIADSPAAAVANAVEKSGVIIVSDSYPEASFGISFRLYNQAQKKGLKLYVEYPTSFPGINIPGDVFHATLERGVITSEAFTPLKPMDIVGINDCYALKVNVKHPLMVLAKVAGFDKAEYGIDDVEAYPLLFQEGNCMVALAKLSNFKTGRYGPNNSWKAIWNYIVSWLIDDSAFTFKTQWPSDVTPMYPVGEKLPEDAKNLMIKRGAEWFYNGRFFIHPSWKERWLTYQGNGSMPVGPSVPQSFLDGDGSMGILEGHASNIYYDGSQDYRYWLRCDVQGETAFALAAAGKYLGIPEHCEVSEHLMDFIFNKSNFREGSHSDRNSPVYGLLGWSYTHPYIFYSDDNARCVLGLIGALACLKTDRWDREIVENILANFRISSKNGFYSQGGSLTQAQIQQSGWQALGGREDLRHIQPHYESWMWACYLWLYDKTGYQPLLDKAKAAIRITMEAYPDRWKWTNGIQQERARMILPLAWLVRVEDTEEHRKWLDMVVSKLLENQQECGAIQEELGAGQGDYGHTPSNKRYGVSEAPLIFDNGDPVADMLYTTNFAFFALNEAAQATGNKKYKEAVSKMSDFLTRIQVKSSKHPDLDGAWFRAFDYKRWDYWASNADHGWGAWSTLTGWIQSWIIATQVLFEQNTSYWESTQNVAVKQYMDETVKFMLEP